MAAGGYRPSRRYLLALLALGALPVPAGAAPDPARAPVEDFDAFWRAVDESYAYFEARRGAWRRARELWRPRAARASSRDALLACLEGAAWSLYDDHVGFSEPSANAPRRVPAETDLWASWKGGAAVLESVRTYGDADVAGLHPGHVVTAIDRVPIERVVRDLLEGAAKSRPEARDWALRHALAGPRQGVMRIEVEEGARRRAVTIERLAPSRGNGPLVIGRRMGDERDLGYIRIRHDLADAALRAQFDGAMLALRDTRALILDLREVGSTAGRDNTLAILSRFIAVETPWQARETRTRERVTDKVAPRDWAYRAPLAVLVDRWTASEGEALANGLHAIGARLVGTPMAGMRGELRRVTLPHSGIVASFPAQKVFHVDGTPREVLRPTVAIDPAAPSGGPGDPILYQALKLLEQR